MRRWRAPLHIWTTQNLTAEQSLAFLFQHLLVLCFFISGKKKIVQLGTNENCTNTAYMPCSFIQTDCTIFNSKAFKTDCYSLVTTHWYTSQLEVPKTTCWILDFLPTISILLPFVLRSTFSYNQFMGEILYIHNQINSLSRLVFRFHHMIAKSCSAHYHFILAN